MTTPRPLYWSVRRELWENRYLTIAPCAVAALALLTTIVVTFRLPHRMRGLAALDPVRRHALFTEPGSLMVAVIMFSTFVAGLFYSFDALHGERRDRSILFWKSMPVSDRTAVLAKAGVPLVVLPLLALALSVATYLNLLAVSSAILAVHGVSPAPLLAEVRFVQEPIVMAYGLAVHALWFAPVYAWLLLVSAWARRSPFLWAVLPFLAAGIVERIALHTAHVPAFLRARFLGAMAIAFIPLPVAKQGVIDGLAELTPLKFLASPVLWVGLAFAAVCLAAAIRLRRDQQYLC